MTVKICITVLAAAIIVLAVLLYRLHGKYDALLDMVVSLSSAVTQMDKELADMHGTVTDAKELIAATKEVTEMQLETEKKFREGLQSIIDY